MSYAKIYTDSGEEIDDPECTCSSSFNSHTCPFGQEIEDDNSECTCCEYCTEECAMKI